MIIILNESATEEQIQHVAEKVEQLGLQPSISRGTYRTIIGVIGDEDKLQVEPLPGDPRRRAGRADPQAVQAGQPRVPPEATRSSRSARGARSAAATWR